MPVISFASPKGGAGKTTSALLFASELASKGADIVIIDADPARWITQWGRLPGKPDNLEIISDVAEDSIIDLIESASARAQFVVVDCEGTASLLVANAIGMSDLVVVPTQGSPMDAKGAAQTIRLIKNQEKVLGRPIPHSVLITRTSGAILTRSLKDVREQLERAGVGIFETAVAERSAYKDIFAYGGLLSDLPKHIYNLDKACENARELAGEIIIMLKGADKRAKVA